jgi:hypothetical protein
MDYLFDLLGILGALLLTAKFVVTRQERERIFSHHPATHPRSRGTVGFSATVWEKARTIS